MATQCCLLPLPRGEVGQKYMSRFHGKFFWKWIFTLRIVRLSHINENLIQVWNWNHFAATFLKPSHTLLINEAAWLKKHKGVLNKQWKYVSKRDWQVKPFVSQLWKPKTLISLCNYIPWTIELCTMMQTWGFRLIAGQQEAASFGCRQRCFNWVQSSVWITVGHSQSCLMQSWVALRVPVIH